ncbi:MULTISPECIES: HAD family hydrolase [unclassified Isoptericola]|uniref:HAD family hydrolase n=1 Tax=unclassified Isoptericola TaxID=2623355 RepID=UPI002712AE56|nr:MULTISPECIES: HAD family hydrolase [unclassified Isoptericola]MDO8145127.1 HAD family hydrolase [Isoptericola sp. 178]MDO8148764.1 HAD family hydrolase [Isoptericola sp. b515]MDO8151295.1 HAD family hydrolase [Isoptericola sp. b408]
MIWLLDLDNTLVSRDAAFAAWAARAVADDGGTDDDLAAIVAADDGGFAPKADVARELIARLGWADDVPAAVDRFRAGIRDHVRAYDGVLDDLDALRAGGDRVAVVTNGVSHQQRGKIDRCGVEARVDAIVVSGEEGVQKPDPALLEIALERLGAADADRGRVWMVGDAGHADVAAGRAAGTRTGWVSHGRRWDVAHGDAPDVAAATTREVLAAARAAQPDSRSAQGLV